MKSREIFLAYPGLFDTGEPKAWFWGERGRQIGRCRYWDDSTVGQSFEDLGSPEDGELHDLGLWYYYEHGIEFSYGNWEDLIDQEQRFIVPIGIRTEDSENLEYLRQVRFPERLENYLREGKAGVLFFCIGEWFVSQEHIDHISAFVENNHYEDIRVGILHDNLADLHVHESVRHCQVPHWFVHKQATGEWVFPEYREYHNRKISQYLYENRNFRKKKTFTCLTRRISEPRIYFAGLFRTSRLLQEECYLSHTHLGSIGPETGEVSYRRLQNWAEDYAEHSPYMRAVLEYYKVLGGARSDMPGLDLPELGDQVHDLISSTYNENLYRDSFVSIVPETVEQVQGVQFFSEKIARPLYAMQPFVLFSTQGSLAKLRDLGYQTFGDWWDESYDDVEDERERVVRISKIIHKILLKNKETLFRMTQEMEPVLLHNARTFIGSKHGEEVIELLTWILG